MANTRADVTVAMAVDGEDQVTKAINRVGNQMEKTAKATNKASGEMKKQFRFMRGGMGQLGYQVQDIAVQLQSGQNAMIVFGQQGSQIASIFGPQGAVIGAFLAVGAAIGTSLLPGLFKTNEELKKLRDNIPDVIDRFDDLTAAGKAYARQLAQQNIAALTQEQDDYKEKLLETIANLEKLRNPKKGSIVLADELAEEEAELARLNSAIDDAEAAIQRQREAVDDRTNAGENLLKRLQDERNGYLMTEKALAIHEARLRGDSEALIREIGLLYDQKNAFDELIEGVKAENEAREQAHRDQKRRDAEMDKARKKQASLTFGYAEATDTSTAATPQMESLINQYEQRLKAVDAYFENEMTLIGEQGNIRQELELQQYMDRLALEEWFQSEKARIAKDAQLATTTAMLQNVQSVMAITESQMGQLKGLFEDGSAAGKAFYVVQQALAAASAIVNGLMASMAIRAAYAQMAAMSGPAAPAVLAAGETHANIATGLGFATAGMIAGQTIASFEGGGTFNGVRSGGMDGKGGRMAMVHPNEKITDMEKSGSEAAPINVSFNIVANDTRGFDELLMSRRGQIISMLNKAVNNRGRASIA
jgi:DNA repair exonuclease SbcCD ATPase subunit